jgi:hypothetical protein
MHVGFKQLEKLVEKDADPTFVFLVDRVRECMAEGDLAESDPRGVALTIWGHTHGLCSLYTTLGLRQFPSTEAFREFYCASVKSLLKGLR